MDSEKLSNKDRNMADNISTCEYFGISNCDCCKVVKKILNPETKTLDINEPSTSSTDADFVDFNFRSDELKLNEFEECFKILLNRSVNPTDEEEIDVVNDVPCFESVENDEEIDVVNVEPEKSFIEFDDDVPLAVFLQTDKPVRSNFVQNENIKIENEISEQEIDVVTDFEPQNTDATVENSESTVENTEIEKSFIEFNEDIPLAVYLQENKPVRIVQTEINHSPEFDDDAPLSTYLQTQTSNINKKRKKPTPEEPIDVVNLTDSPDYNYLSDILVEANKKRIHDLTKPDNTVIDLIKCEDRETIIEISDSPCPVPEVITVEDDDYEEKKSSFGPCPVCFEDLAKCEVMATMCGHIFCATCIKTVVKNVKKCPKCRKHLTLKSVHPLFF